MVDTDTILMYLLQCRADDFITVFEKLYNIPQEAMRTEMKECVKYFGMSSENCLDCSLALTKAIEGEIDSYKGLLPVYWLYDIALANRILLSADMWTGDYLKTTINKCRESADRILQYIKVFAGISDDRATNFLENYKQCALNTDIFDEEMPILTSKGYRKIDCLLFKAGLSLDVETMLDLLEKGANPEAYIEGIFSDEEKDELCYWSPNLLEECWDHIGDTCEFCGQLEEFWESGLRREKPDVFVSNGSVLFELFIGAVYQSIVNIVEDFQRKHKKN